MTLTGACTVFKSWFSCFFLHDYAAVAYQSINQTSIVSISQAKPGSVAPQPNQCSTAKSRKQFRNINRRCKHRNSMYKVIIVKYNVFLWRFQTNPFKAWRCKAADFLSYSMYNIVTNCPLQLFSTRYNVAYCPIMSEVWIALCSTYSGFSYISNTYLIKTSN